VDTMLPNDPEIASWYQEMEKMRDPTHIQAYTEEKWQEMVQEAGFILHETVTVPKTHDFPTWAKRAGLNREGIGALNKFFVDAPDKVQDYFQIETFAGEVEAYTDRKVLVYASRPPKK